MGMIGDSDLRITYTSDNQENLDLALDAKRRLCANITGNLKIEIHVNTAANIRPFKGMSQRAHGGRRADATRAKQTVGAESSKPR